MKVVSFSFVFPLSLFSSIVFLPHRSLLPPVVLLLLSSFLLLESLLPLTVLFLSFLLLLVLLCVFFKASHTEWHVIVNVSKFESASSSSFRIFVFTQFCFIVTAFTSRAKWKVAVCVFEPLSAATFTSTFVVSLVSLCLSADVTTRSLPFIPAFFCLEGVSADDSADGFDNTSLENKNKNRTVCASNDKINWWNLAGTALARNGSVWLKQQYRALSLWWSNCFEPHRGWRNIHRPSSLKNGRAAWQHDMGVHVLADVNVTSHDHLLVRLGWNNTPAHRRRTAPSVVMFSVRELVSLFLWSARRFPSQHSRNNTSTHGSVWRKQ